MKDLLPYIVEQLDLLDVRYEIHHFDSGAIMVDIFIEDKLYVIQIFENDLGLSLVTDETGLFDIIPDKSYNDIEEFKKDLQNTLSPLRQREVIVDCSTVSTDKDFQRLLSDRLAFPSFYGKNWDAFWDAVTGLVEMPKQLTFKNYKQFKNRFPADCRILEKCLNDMNDKYPSIDCKVVYD